MNATICIDEDARRIANLRVLQRIDSSIIDVISSATHVVLYEFNELAQAWEKRNVEGSLFVAKRSDAPRFKLIVMNRNAKENLEIPLAAKFQMQVREPYLIFRLDNGEGQQHSKEKEKTPIRGIWFHDGKEREVICNVLQKVMKVLAHATELDKQPELDPYLDQNENGIVKQNANLLISGLNIGEPTQLDNTATTKPSDTEHVSANIGNNDNTSSLDNHNHDNLILDKKTLQLSLMSLLQEDKFLDLIHAQYLKVVHARAQRDITDTN